MNRRNWMGLVFGLAAVWPALMRGQRPRSCRIRVRAGPRASEPSRAGIAFGVKEARHTVQLLGAPVEIVTSPGGEPPDAEVSRVVIDFGAGVPPIAVLAGTVASVPDDALAVGSSPAWRREALAGQPRAGLRVVDWDARLRRYGAAQLNERFLRHAAAPMDEGAWHGWMAVKAALEIALAFTAGDEADPAAATFDGHKGVPLVLDSSTRHLRQPVYLVGSETAADPVEVQPEGARR